MVPPAIRKLTKNPCPVYVLEDGFKVQHLVVFTKNSDEVLVRAIPDDTPDSIEMFDNAVKPSVDDFSIVVSSFKSQGRWVAHLDSDFWYDSGAAVLLQLSSQKYVYIGAQTFQFEVQPRDEVVEFRVRLEGDTTIAWIHGKNNVYLLSSRVFVPTTKVDDIDNPYASDAEEHHPIRNIVE